MAATRLFTIGHSNHPLAHLVGLLEAAGVTAVADVRSQPFSPRVPQFNRTALQRGLEEHGLVYGFLGNQLGGRPREPQLYDDDGRVDYERVRRLPRFQKGLAELGRALDDHAVALLCAEEDPLDCHRGLMIAPALVERGIHPAHLRGDGSIESTTAFEDRLLAETKVGVGVLDGLFALTLTGEERQQLLAAAYRVQARRKAFRLRPENSPTWPADPSESMDGGE